MWVKAAVSTTHISGIENPIQITIFSDITEENYPVVREYIRTMELPECAELLSELDGVYKNDGKEEKE